MLEHLGGRQSDLEVALDRRDHLDDEQGMTAKLEEVVGHSDAEAPEQTLPQRDERLLARARCRLLRDDSNLGRERSLTEPTTIDLAVWQPWQLGNFHEPAWQHVLRQTGREVLAPALGARGRSRHDEGDELQCGGVGRAG